MPNGKIIFLNGCSSSGKSSIAKALQQILDEPYLHFGIDSYMMMLPEQFYMGSKRAKLPGLLAPLMKGFHGSIAATVEVGNNVIVDHVLQFPEWLKDCVQVLADYRVLFVAVRCPLEELERRERNRNRAQGMARGQYDMVHAHGICDVEVNTSVLDTVACALRIKEALQQVDTATAFRRLKGKLA